ncbi:MAG: hypothetical protein E5V92_05425 [Mesorhizobium sp.]|nr:MAG: hypothetical protein EOS61_02530 [Mesorhizobium sp.]TIW00761.1 MAG: hypothetical protein E5V85_02700 [Mesorhizobium sp.]TJW88480.1 MAG: hypothetical protein E5V92_05425 [Mesorhizobium sp.]
MRQDGSSFGDRYRNKSDWAEFKKNAGDRREKLAELLRGQFASEAVRRHLRGLPIFRVEQWLPERLRTLLDRLAKKEDGRPR